MVDAQGRLARIGRNRQTQVSPVRHIDGADADVPDLMVFCPIPPVEMKNYPPVPFVGTKVHAL
jgi:hypothetical protein